jgi:hypothetical protein
MIRHIIPLNGSTYFITHYFLLTLISIFPALLSLLFVNPKKSRTKLFPSTLDNLVYLVIILGHVTNYFFEGALFITNGGNPNGIEPPNFIKGLSRIYYNVGLLEGFETNIFFIRSIA